MTPQLLWKWRLVGADMFSDPVFERLFLGIGVSPLPTGQTRHAEPGFRLCINASHAVGFVRLERFQLGVAAKVAENVRFQAGTLTSSATAFSEPL